MKTRLLVLAVMLASFVGLAVVACDSGDGDKTAECNEEGKTTCEATHSSCVSACDPLGGGYESCVADCNTALCACLSDNGCTCETTPCEPACGEGFYCSEGTCVEEQTQDCDPECAAGTTCIQGTCIDDTPPACDPACEDGFSCVAGACVEDDVDDCDPACEDGFSCVDGECEEDDVDDCAPACEDGFTCIDGECEADDVGDCEPDTQAECGEDYGICLPDCDPLDADYVECVEDCDEELCDCLTMGDCPCEDEE